MLAYCSYRVDESQLTGESDDVVKEPPSAAAPAAAANGSNGGSSGNNRVASCLCMSGSKVLEGFGRMLVLAVGPNSQQVRGCLRNARCSCGCRFAKPNSPQCAHSCGCAVAGFSLLFDRLCGCRRNCHCCELDNQHPVMVCCLCGHGACVIVLASSPRHLPGWSAAFRS